MPSKSIYSMAITITSKATTKTKKYFKNISRIPIVDFPYNTNIVSEVQVLKSVRIRVCKTLTALFGFFNKKVKKIFRT